MTFLVAFLLGVAYVLPPGPVMVETVRRSLLGGLRPALGVQVGAVAGDLVYALLALAGIGAWLPLSELRAGLGLFGAGLLVFLGISAIRDGLAAGALLRGQAAPEPAPDGPRALLPHLGAGLTMALANPYALVFWLSVGGSALEGSLIGLAGFFVGSLLASLLVAVAAAQLHRGSGQRLARWIWGGCGGLLAALGLQLGYSSLMAWWG